MSDRFSIREAAARGIERVRLPNWANPMDHLKLDIVDGQLGPWLHLWCPINKWCNGRDPVDVFWPFGPLKVDVDAWGYEAYTGPLPDSDAYRAAVARFDELPS